MPLFVIQFVLIGYCVCISIESAEQFGFCSLIGRLILYVQRSVIIWDVVMEAKQYN